MTTKEVCAQLKISRATFYRVIKSGSIRPLAGPGKRRFAVRDVRDLIERMRALGREEK